MECAKIEEKWLLKKIEAFDLEENMKENILSCLRMAKSAARNGIRYSQKWLCVYSSKN